jgi:outer membrane lipoprotein-sorting protein
MRFLRTVSTRRLLAGLTALIIVAVGGSAIAVAAVGNGPVPKKRSLASAVHKALSAKAVNGLSAHITFTNNLIGSTNLQGSDPLLTGAPGRLWIGDGRIRLELQSDSGNDAQVVFNRGAFWVYDPAMNVVYRGKLPALTFKATDKSSGSSKQKQDSVPTIAQIQKAIKRLATHLGISGATPTDVGGQPAYRVAVSPKSNGGLIGGLKLAWDANHGVPLDFAVLAKGSSTPVLELKATGISYGPVPASVFTIKPPSGTKVVHVSVPKATGSGSAGKANAKNKKPKEITGVTAVQKHLSFTLAAPATLAGRSRKSVSLVGGSGHHGAMLFYGTGLGGIAVIEQPASDGGSALPSSSNSGGNGGSGLTLPTVNINGVTAQQLPTPLGTMLQFRRGGVSYLVLGSVTADTADAAARAL